MRKRNFATGDLNFAAALISLGIPLFKDKPITLVASSNGCDYKRFHFDLVSICGKYDVYAMSDAWRNKDGFSNRFPNHPMTKIMGFISSKQASCKTESDWLETASKWLGLPIDSIIKTYNSILQVCASSPESEISYVLAYIKNRESLIRDIKAMDANGEFSTMLEFGKSLVNLGAKIKTKDKNFILSHIK